MKSIKVLLTALGITVGCVSASTMIAQDATPPAPPMPPAAPAPGAPKMHKPHDGHRGDQGPRMHARKGRPDPEHMAKALGLTPDQQAKVKDVITKEREAFKALPNDDTRREKAMELAKGAHAQIQAILTPEQQAKMEKIRAKRAESRRDARMEHMRGDRPGPRHQAMAGRMDDRPMPPPHMRGGRPDFQHRAERLNLTAEQKEKIKGIMDKQRTAYQALAQDTRSQIRALLTPEQQAQADQMREDSGEGRGWDRNGSAKKDRVPNPGNKPQS